MRKICTLTALLFTGSLYAQHIARWDFNNTTNPSYGIGTATITAPSIPEYATDGYPNAGNGTALNTSNYPVQGANSGTAGVEFAVSTVGKSNIVIGWYDRRGPQAARHTQFQYSIDNGANWTVFNLTAANAISIEAGVPTSSGIDVTNDVFTGTAGATVTSSTWFYRQINLSGINATIAEQDDFKFRIVTVFQPNVTPQQYQAASLVTAYLETDVIMFDEVTVSANGTIIHYHPLSDGNLSQDWTNIELLDEDDDWNLVPGIKGYTGNLPVSAGTNPQLIVVNDDANRNVSVDPNRTNPSTSTPTLVIREFHIANPTIALGASFTYSYLALHLNTIGRQDMQLSFKVRDIDGSTRNSVSQVAVQYRTSTTPSFSGINWINIPEAYIADATTGPNLATQETDINISLPAAINDQPFVEIRFIGANAGNTATPTGDVDDEWIGIDDIVVTQGVALPLQLQAFQATTANQQVNLSWQTANEINVDRFEVQSSKEGANYTTVGTVVANNQAANTYSFTDALSTGTSYYRLKMIDKDGSFTYSNIETVKGKAAGALKVSPNPVVGNTITASHEPAKAGATLTLYTLGGATVKTQAVPVGTVNTKLNITGITKGVYVVVYDNAGERTQTQVQL